MPLLQVIKDFKLFLVVAVLVCIDVAILITWQIVDPFYRETDLGVAMVRFLPFCFNLVLATLLLILLLLFCLSSPLNSQFVFLHFPISIVQPSAQNEDIMIVPEMEFCQSKRMTIFLGSIYVYKGLLMVIGSHAQLPDLHH